MSRTDVTRGSRSRCEGCVFNLDDEICIYDLTPMMATPGVRCGHRVPRERSCLGCKFLHQGRTCAAKGYRTISVRRCKRYDPDLRKFN